MLLLSSHGGTVLREGRDVLHVLISLWSGSVVSFDGLPDITGRGVLLLEFGHRIGEAGVERVPFLVAKERFVSENGLQVILEKAVALVDPLLVAVAAELAGRV